MPQVNLKYSRAQFSAAATTSIQVAAPSSQFQAVLTGRIVTIDGFLSPGYNGPILGEILKRIR